MAPLQDKSDEVYVPCNPGELIEVEPSRAGSVARRVERQSFFAGSGERSTAVDAAPLATRFSPPQGIEASSALAPVAQSAVPKWVDCSLP
jgi:hypothetical protein